MRRRISGILATAIIVFPAVAFAAEGAATGTANPDAGSNRTSPGASSSSGQASTAAGKANNKKHHHGTAGEAR